MQGLLRSRRRYSSTSPWRALAWVDADEFARCVEQGRRLAREGWAEDAAAHFARAVDLYRGDFLGEDPHEEW
ncbi:MAG: BTAD domain-containing putative transcriptional regulator, partial [Bacillota bacterium]|nr:BTAD domain-containing putative transcriptional regulator [Bacillota bacterium]